MPKDKLTWLVGVYRVAILGTLGVIGYLQSSYVTKEKFNDYIAHHEQWSQEVLRSLRYDISEIKTSIREINIKLDKRGFSNNMTETNFNNVDFYGKRR